MSMQKTVVYGLSNGQGFLDLVERLSSDKLDCDKSKVADAFALIMEGSDPDTYVETDIGEFELYSISYHGGIDGYLIRYDGRGKTIFYWIDYPRTKQIDKYLEQHGKYGYTR